jgi:cytochrome P450
MTRDESLYPDPEVFRPERWLEPRFSSYREPLSQYPEIKGHSGFGWGNRSCVGQGFSEVVMFTMASTILWGCNITKKTDGQTGKEMEIPWMDIEPPNAIVRPTWFPLDVKPRSERKTRPMEDPQKR